MGGWQEGSFAYFVKSIGVLYGTDNTAATTFLGRKFDRVVMRDFGRKASTPNDKNTVVSAAVNQMVLINKAARNARPKRKSGAKFSYAPVMGFSNDEGACVYWNMKAGCTGKKSTNAMHKQPYECTGDQNALTLSDRFVKWSDQASKTNPPLNLTETILEREGAYEDTCDNCKTLWADPNTKNLTFSSVWVWHETKTCSLKVNKGTSTTLGMLTLGNSPRLGRLDGEPKCDGKACWYAADVAEGAAMSTPGGSVYFQAYFVDDIPKVWLKTLKPRAGSPGSFTTVTWNGVGGSYDVGGETISNYCEPPSDKTVDAPNCPKTGKELADKIFTPWNYQGNNWGFLRIIFQRRVQNNLDTRAYTGDPDWTRQKFWDMNRFMFSYEDGTEAPQKKTRARFFGYTGYGVDYSQAFWDEFARELKDNIVSWAKNGCGQCPSGVRDCASTCFYTGTKAEDIQVGIYNAETALRVWKAVP